MNNSQAEVTFYTDAANEWRWRLQDANGRVIADSGEGYTRLGDAVKGWQNVVVEAAGAQVEIEGA